MTEGGGITPFFFTNFHEAFEAEDIWQMFQKYGKVWDVFIAKRRTQQGKNFGFVRFMNVLNPKLLEEQLDTIYIGDLKLRVNQPKYGRKPQGQYVNGLNNGKGATVTSQMTRGGLGCFGDVVSGGRASQGGLSYAQVVQGRGNKAYIGEHPWRQNGGGDISTWRGMDIKAEVTNHDWLSKCMVGRLIELWHIMKVQEAFLMEGFTTIRARYLGDNMVLLYWEKEDNLHDIFEGEGEWLGKIFESIVSWNPDVGSGNRLTWVRVFGLPLHVWNSDCLGKVVATMGSLVLVVENTLGLEGVEYARILIRTSSLSMISIATP